jgi:hypothetical protein
MDTIHVTCSRCKTNIEGVRGEDFTGGFYDVRPTDSPAGWDKYANPGETVLCDPCMWKDPRYQKVHGDFNARNLEASQRQVAEAKASEADARRLARFSITPEIFLLFSSGWFEVVANPLPADAQIVSAFYDPPRHCFTVVLHSEAFAPVQKGAEIPDVQAPHIKRIETVGGNH